MQKYSVLGSSAIEVNAGDFKILAIAKWNKKQNQYVVTYSVRLETVETWEKIDVELDNSVYANSTIETINHDIAAYITKLLEDETLQPAFDRYMYSQDCFDIGDSILTLLSAYQKGEISKDEAMARNFEYAKLYLR